jgi:hypothetical protein
LTQAGTLRGRTTVLIPSIAATALASALALISLGGGLYEFRLVDAPGVAATRHP